MPGQVDPEAGSEGRFVGRGDAGVGCRLFPLALSPRCVVSIVQRGSRPRSSSPGGGALRSVCLRLLALHGSHLGFGCCVKLASSPVMSMEDDEDDVDDPGSCIPVVSRPWTRKATHRSFSMVSAHRSVSSAQLTASDPAKSPHCHFTLAQSMSGEGGARCGDSQRGTLQPCVSPRTQSTHPSRS